MAALEARSDYAATQSDYYTHCWDIPPQYGPPYPQEGSEFAATIDGKDGSWHLPLPPLNAESVEPRTNVIGDGQVRAATCACSKLRRCSCSPDVRRRSLLDRLPHGPLYAIGVTAMATAPQAAEYAVAAAERLVKNHAAVMRFASRALGTPGRRFTAPLAEPDAVPDTSREATLSTALQMTALALLEGPKAAQAVHQQCDWLGSEAGERQANAEAAAACLAYIRDRVGVPRDLRLPAARELRAHLNWTIDAIADAVGRA